MGTGRTQLSPNVQDALFGQRISQDAPTGHDDRKRATQAQSQAQSQLRKRGLDRQMRIEADQIQQDPDQKNDDGLRTLVKQGHAAEVDSFIAGPALKFFDVDGVTDHGRGDAEHSPGPDPGDDRIRHEDQDVLLE